MTDSTAQPIAGQSPDEALPEAAKFYPQARAEEDDALIGVLRSRTALLRAELAAAQQENADLHTQLEDAHDAYEQLSRLVTNDQQPETSAGTGEDGDA